MLLNGHRELVGIKIFLSSIQNDHDDRQQHSSTSKSKQTHHKEYFPTVAELIVRADERRINFDKFLETVALTHSLTEELITRIGTSVDINSEKDHTSRREIVTQCCTILSHFEVHILWLQELRGRWHRFIENDGPGDGTTEVEIDFISRLTKKP